MEDGGQRMWRATRKRGLVVCRLSSFFLPVPISFLDIHPFNFHFLFFLYIYLQNDCIHDIPCIWSGFVHNLAIVCASTGPLWFLWLLVALSQDPLLHIFWCMHAYFPLAHTCLYISQLCFLLLWLNRSPSSKGEGVAVWPKWGVIGNIHFWIKIWCPSI